MVIRINFSSLNIRIQDENMNKKAEFDLRTYLIGTVLVMGILVTFAMSYSSMASKYGVSTASAGQFNATYNKLSTVQTFTDEQSKQLTDSKLNDASQSTEFWGNTLSTAKKIFALVSLPISLIGDVFKTIPIDPLWQDIAIMLIVILFVTAFIFMIFQSRG